MRPQEQNRGLMRLRGSRESLSAGFTLIEAMVGLLILTLITAAIFAQLNQMQIASASEGNKLDLTQEAREFADQIVRDLHMAGYPKVTMYSPALPNSSHLVAAGLVRVSPTEILLEGDVQTSGTVDSVDIQYVPQDPVDKNCPCIRRTEVQKVDADPLAQPAPPGSALSTEVDHVLPPAQAGEDLFTFFDKNGNQVPVTAGVDISSAGGQSTIDQIQTVKINLNLFSPAVDPASNKAQRISLSVTGHLNKY
jgi:type II secretory pathway pseudopilin PulG